MTQRTGFPVGTVGQKSTDQGGAKSAPQNVPLRERSSSSEEGEATRAIRKEIFDLGLSLLGRTEPELTGDEQKRAEKNARSLLGKLVSRMHDDHRLLAILKAAEGSIEPQAYIVAAVAKTESKRVAAGSGRRAPSPAVGSPEHSALLRGLGFG